MVHGPCNFLNATTCAQTAISVQSAHTLIGGLESAKIRKKTFLAPKWSERVGAAAIVGVAIFPRRGLKSAKLRVHRFPNRERWWAKSARGGIRLFISKCFFPPLILQRSLPPPPKSEPRCVKSRQAFSRKFRTEKKNQAPPSPLPPAM